MLTKNTFYFGRLPNFVHFCGPSAVVPTPTQQRTEAAVRDTSVAPMGRFALSAASGSHGTLKPDCGNTICPVRGRRDVED
jgi:hypothetical protein